MLGILGALEQEVGHIRGLLDDPVELRPHHLVLHKGRIGNEEVILARCGVGKVNAAIAAVSLITAGADSLLVTGVAGALDPDLRVGDMVIATDLVQHDVNITALGRPPGELLYEPMSWKADADASAKLAGVCQDLVNATPGMEARVIRGRIASGDQFIANSTEAQRIRDQFDAACVEMEGAAIAQTAAKFGVPFTVVRAISDSADDKARHDFPNFLEQCGQFAARVVSAYTT